MSFEHRGRLPLDYHPVVYPGSVLRFRGPGPDREPDAPFVLCLGGSETFGRFIHAPFAAQLQEALPVDVINMGVMNAGLDVILRDQAINAAVQTADAVVLQVMGAQNMTNRFYSVHPRRNDRFVKAATMLRTLYRDVDFTEFHFTRHLLTHLNALSPDRFGVVEAELRAAWVARMKAFIARVPVPVHLLWLSRRHPDEAPAGPMSRLGPDPLFIRPEMLAEVAGAAASLSIAVPPPEGPQAATRGMFFGAREEAAARVLPGPDSHDLAARLLHPLLS